MFVKWVQFQHPGHYERLFAVPNGEYRAPASARRLKAEGVKAGVSDLIFLFPSPRYPGLVMEFKRADETWSAVSADQRKFLYQAEQDGFGACVAFGFEHGRTLFTDYLNGQFISVDACKQFVKEKKRELRI